MMFSFSSAPDAEARLWLSRLNQALVLRWCRVRIFQDYYEGDHRLVFAGEQFRNAFGKLFSEFADNFCDIVVDSLVERLTVQGFRMTKDASADADAWEIWQYNNMDSASEILHVEALISEESYALVAPPGPGEKWPKITVEHPSQVIVVMAPGDQRRRLAALKRWVDDDGNIRANVYLPDMVYKYVAKGDGTVFQAWVQAGNVTPSAIELHWEPYTEGGIVQHTPNPMGVVPIVPFRNKPRLVRVAESELKKVIPVQDAINMLVLDMMVAAEAAAIPARWASGLALKINPETNQPEPPPDITKTKLFQAADPDAKFGAFPAGDLGNYVTAINLMVEHMAVQTRTPRHYFTTSGQAPSGDAIKSAETGLVAKTHQRARHFGESHEEVIRLCFLAIGDSAKAQAYGAETIWADPEYRTESEHIDALLKQKAFNIPDQILWEKAGYSPQEIARIQKMQADERAAGMTEQVIGAPTLKRTPIQTLEPASDTAVLPTGNPGVAGQ